MTVQYGLPDSLQEENHEMRKWTNRLPISVATCKSQSPYMQIKFMNQKEQDPGWKIPLFVFGATIAEFELPGWIFVKKEALSLFSLSVSLSLSLSLLVSLFLAHTLSICFSPRSLLSLSLFLSLFLSLLATHINPLTEVMRVWVTKYNVMILIRMSLKPFLYPSLNRQGWAATWPLILWDNSTQNLTGFVDLFYKALKSGLVKIRRLKAKIKM